MRVKKVFVMMVVVLSMLAVFAVSAHAGATWYTCEVNMAGIGMSWSYVKLTDKGGNFTNKWFLLRSDRKKEMLAVALTAMTNNMEVQVYTDISEPGYPVINSLYLKP